MNGAVSALPEEDLEKRLGGPLCCLLLRWNCKEADVQAGS